MEKFELHIDEELKLSLVDPLRTAEFFQLVEKNRNYLRQWMTWLDSTRSPLDLEKFIEQGVQDFQNNSGLRLWIIRQQEIIGIIHLYDLHLLNKRASIGYWISEEHRGKGFVKKAARTLIQYAFSHLQINRLSIFCATENKASQSIPLSLGFQKEGILRENEWLYDHYVDHVIFGLLKNEWQPNRSL